MATRIVEIVFGIAAVVGVVGLFVLARAFRRQQSSDGEVVRTARRITVRYVVDGKAYELEGSRNYQDPPPIGARVAVRYLSGKPASASIADENFAGAIAALVVAIVFGLLGAGLLFGAS